VHQEIAVPRWLTALLAVVLVVLLGVAARAVFLPATNPRLTRENLQRIQPGMRRAEVEAVLGPPGNYQTRPTRAISPSIRSPYWPGSLSWASDEGWLEVWLDGDGGVLSVNVILLEPVPVGLLDLLRWRWDRWRVSGR
jgi:hypothetical protein